VSPVNFLLSAEKSLCRLGRHCPRSLKGIGANVSICVRAGLPKPRGVPDTERVKDTKTLDYASTPLDANTVLCVVISSPLSPAEAGRNNN